MFHQIVTNTVKLVNDGSSFTLHSMLREGCGLANRDEKNMMPTHTGS